MEHEPYLELCTNCDKKLNTASRVVCDNCDVAWCLECVPQNCPFCGQYLIEGLVVGADGKTAKLCPVCKCPPFTDTGTYGECYCFLDSGQMADELSHVAGKQQTHIAALESELATLRAMVREGLPFFTELREQLLNAYAHINPQDSEEWSPETQTTQIARDLIVQLAALVEPGKEE